MAWLNSCVRQRPMASPAARIFGNCGAGKLGRKSRLQEIPSPGNPISLSQIPLLMLGSPACPAHLEQWETRIRPSVGCASLFAPCFLLGFPGAAFQLQTWESGLETPRLCLVWPENPLGIGSFPSSKGMPALLLPLCQLHLERVFIYFGDIPVGG